MSTFPVRPIKIGLLTLTVITVLAVLAACGGSDEKSQPTGERVQPLAAGTGPTVSFAPASITMSANPGSKQDIPVVLTAGSAMSNVTVNVPTALKSVLSASPTALGSLSAGQTATFSVKVAPGASEALRTLSGALTVRAGFATTSKTLPVSLTLVAPESINGIAVPPEPPKELNDLTLAGFDLNGNGVRDDVERMIAQKTTTRSGFDQAMPIAEDWQRFVASVAITQAESDAGMLRVDCFAFRILDNPIGINSGEIKRATFNTSARIEEGKRKSLALNPSIGDPLHDCPK